jgi:hypothetical protein
MFRPQNLPDPPDPPNQPNLPPILQLTLQQFLIKFKINLTIDVIRAAKNKQILNGCLILKAESYTEKFGALEFQFIIAENLKSVCKEMFEKSKVKAVYGPRIVEVLNSGFRECKELIELDLGALKKVADFGFFECAAISNLSLPSLTSVGGYGFEGCAAISNLSLPSLTSVGRSGF